MQSSAAMGAGGGGELFASYDEVQIRRVWEMEVIKTKLARNEAVDINICRLERTSGDSPTVKLGLKRGKLLYVFKYPTHSVERDKHRNVITRARFVKQALENAGYQPIPWDFKKNKPPKFWEDTMEEEDDDLYGPADTVADQAKKPETKRESDGESGDEPMDEGLESGEDDDDDSDSDLEIIIDKPATAPKPVVPQQPQESKAIKIEAPPQPSSAPSQPAKDIVPQLPSQPGTAFPAQRTSDIDVNADPTFSPLGKPILQVDIDADLAEHTKPWRLPGADQSDYFNYGFDEFTWEMYRQRQQQMVQNLANQKAETAQMQQFFNGPMPGGMPGAPSAPAAPSGPPTGPAAGAGPAGPAGPAAAAAAMGGMGLPPGGMSEEQMQMMFQQMAATGMDPSQMDFGTFMQMAGGFGAPTGPQGGFGGGPQQGAQGAGGGGGGGGGRGRGGRGRGW